VLSIGETVEEVTDSGFLGTTPTLSCSQLGDDSLLQVCVLIMNAIFWEI
jgi:splicing factor 3B subunit 3